MLSHLVARASALALLGLGACNGSGSSTATVLPVQSTFPVDGATEVEPRRSVSITFARPTTTPTSADIWFDDGAGPLPGKWAVFGDNAVWLWTPSEEFSRGAVIQVRQPNVVVATFRIRELQDEAVYEFPAEQPSGALAWPNGRRVAFVGSRILEVNQTEVVERFAPLTTESLVYGDGEFITFDFDTALQQLTCIRGSLDGAQQYVACPANTWIRAINDRGDIALLVPTDVGTAPAWGVWRLRVDGVAFEPAGQLLTPSANVIGIDIDEAESIYVAHVSTSVGISRFQPGGQEQEHHSSELQPGGVHFGCAGDGMCILAKPNTSSAIQWQHYQPGQGFEVTRTAFSRTLVGGVSFQAFTARSGSTLMRHVEFVNPPFPGAPPSFLERAFRIERDNQALQIALGADPNDATRRRGEWWDFRWNSTTLRGDRKRPGSQTSETLDLHDYASLVVTCPRTVVCDDSGRMIIAYTDASGTGHVIVLD